MSSTGPLIGLVFGTVAAPMTVAVTARPPTRAALTAASGHSGAYRAVAVVLPLATCVVTGWRIQHLPPLPGFLAITVGLGMAAITDARWRLLPKAIVYPAWGVALIALTVATITTGRTAPLITAAITGAGLFTVFAAVSIAAPHALAFGDVRLAGLCGTAMGWWGAAAIELGLLVAFLGAALVTTARMSFGRLDRHAPIPLGPWLAAGSLIAVWVAG